MREIFMSGSMNVAVKRRNGRALHGALHHGLGGNPEVAFGQSGVGSGCANSDSGDFHCRAPRAEQRPQARAGRANSSSGYELVRFGFGEQRRSDQSGNRLEELDGLVIEGVPSIPLQENDTAAVATGRHHNRKDRRRPAVPGKLLMCQRDGTRRLRSSRHRHRCSLLGGFLHCILNRRDDVRALIEDCGV